MRLWYHKGVDVQAPLPHLSVYMGHVRPQESYWYLSATPELLTAAAERFHLYAAEGGISDVSSYVIAPHVQAFFAEHLCHHKRVSPKTITSYRDTFRLLLTFVKEATGKEPSALHIHDLDAPRCPAISRLLGTPTRQRDPLA